ISLNTDGLNNLDPLLVIPRLKRPSKDTLALGVILHRLRAEQEELFNRDLNQSGPSVGPGNILPNSLDAAFIVENPFPNRLLSTERELLPANRAIRSLLVANLGDGETIGQKRQSLVDEVHPSMRHAMHVLKKKIGISLFLVTVPRRFYPPLGTAGKLTNRKKNRRNNRVHLHFFVRLDPFLERPQLRQKILNDLTATGLSPRRA